MESSCLRKRKREGAGQLEQSHVVGLQEVSHPEGIDLSGSGGSGSVHLDSRLPPGWEQFLDIQSGQVHFVNSATQTRVTGDPRCNLLKELAAEQGKNGKCSSGMTLGLDLEMKLPYSATIAGMPGLTLRDKLPNDLAVQPYSGVCLNSSVNLNGVITDSDTSMAATVCLRCHTFVMVSRLSPYCPSCKNLCNVNPVPLTPGNGQA